MTQATTNNEAIGKLFKQVHAMKFSREQADIIFQIFELALADGNTERAFNHRLQEIESRIFSGDAEGAFTAFQWVLAEYQANPKKYEREIFSFLWAAKWTINNLPQMLTVPRSVVEQQLEIFQTLLESHEYGPSGYDKIYGDFLWAMGDADGAIASIKKSLRGMDDLSDCKPCSQIDICDILFAEKRYRKFFRKSKKYQKSPDALCDDQKILFFGDLGLYYILQEKDEDGRLWLKKMQEVAAEESADPNIKMLSRLIFGQTMLGYLHAGIQSFTQGVDFAYTQVNAYDQLLFLKASYALFAALAANEQTVVQMNLPESVSWANSSGEYNTAAVAQLLKDEITALASAIDLRNGNTFQTDTRDTFLGIDLLARS